VEDGMQRFDFAPRTRWVFEAGGLERLGELVRQLVPACDTPRVLMVSDAGVVAAGHYPRAKRLLEQSDCRVTGFHDLQENPTTAHIDAGLAAARQCRPDVLIGLGGGSSMDCAKGINFLYSCGGRMQDYWGVGKATQPMLPLVAVPTTAGTGSESQSFALISDAHTHVKMACGDPKAACAIALLDPELTLTQPASVTALTGIDALSHALETYVTLRRNPLSLCYSREAWRLICRGLPRVLDQPENIEARGAMQLGASLAGLAIETSMLGAAHATANPLTARFGVAHGQAVGMMLPHVIRFNGQIHRSWYTELWDQMLSVFRDSPEQVVDLPSDDPVEAVAGWVERLLRAGGLQTHLSRLGVQADDIGQLAEAATQQWTGTFNPRPLDRTNLESLYQAAL
jgi:alcohol dehydrogenase